MYIVNLATCMQSGMNLSQLLHALVHQECDCHLEIWKYNLEVKIAEAVQVFVAGCTSEVSYTTLTDCYVHISNFISQGCCGNPTGP